MKKLNTGKIFINTLSYDFKLERMSIFRWVRNDVIRRKCHCEEFP